MTAALNNATLAPYGQVWLYSFSTNSLSYINADQWTAFVLPAGFEGYLVLDAQNYAGLSSTEEIEELYVQFYAGGTSFTISFDNVFVMLGTAPAPTAEPTVEPTAEPTHEPTDEPTAEPTPTADNATGIPVASANPSPTNDDSQKEGDSSLALIGAAIIIAAAALAILSRKKATNQN